MIAQRLDLITHSLKLSRQELSLGAVFA